MLDFQNAHEIFSVYGTYPKEDGSISYLLLGRFITYNGNLAILEDHWQLSKMLIPGPIIGHNERALNSLANSMYTTVVADSDVRAGKHLDLIPKRDFGGLAPHLRGLPASDIPQPGEPPDMVAAPSESSQPQFSMEAPPAVFDYFRVGSHQPQIVEIKNGIVFMNNQRLQQDEVNQILHNVKTGVATLKYRRA